MEKLSYPIQCRQRGFTLIELMIALVLGLLVVVAASGMFLSNKRVYAATETIGRIQENQRTAFELLARDLREAAGTPCSAISLPVNMLQSQESTFWSRFPDGLTGTDGGGTNSDRVDLYMTNEADMIRISEHTNPSAVLNVTNSDGVAVDDVVMACNADVSIIFKITQLPSGEIQHNGGGADGNCGQEFQHRKPDLTKCAGASALYGYCFVIPPGKKPGPGCNEVGQGPAVVVRLSIVRWEVRNNGRGGSSLYRDVYRVNGNGMNVASVSSVEVAEGITNLQLKYQSEGSATFADANAPVANWRQVIAVQGVMTAQAAAGAQTGRELEGTDQARLSRVMSSTIALRNRESTL